MPRSTGLGAVFWAFSLAMSVLSGCSEEAPRADRAAPSEGAEGRTTASRNQDDDGVDEANPPVAPAPTREVTIVGGGDLLLHIRVNEAAADQPDGWDHVFSGLRDLVRPSDVVVANLETPLVTDEVPIESGSPPILGAPAAVAPALARAGVDVLGCANNHSYDQRATGLRRTVEAIDAAGLKAAGAHPDRAQAFGAQIVEPPGGRVAVLSYTERINQAPGNSPPEAYVAKLAQVDPRTPEEPQEEIVEAIRAARETADAVVLLIHWSHDFIRTPHHEQRERARWLVDAGVDVIVGSGPHVLQEVERMPSPRGDAVVAYSLGNLVSNQGLRYRVGRPINPTAHPAVTTPEARDGALLRVRLSFTTEGRVELAKLEAIPLWTENNFFRHHAGEDPRRDIRIRPLASVDEATRRERLPRIREALGPAVTIVTDAPARSHRGEGVPATIANPAPDADDRDGPTTPRGDAPHPVPAEEHHGSGAAG